jgi:hypothetical protein
VSVDDLRAPVTRHLAEIYDLQFSELPGAVV